MRSALFLDRDGIINRELGRYVFDVEDVELVVGIGKSIRLARDKGYIVVVISNQGGVAKGLYSLEDVERVNAQILKDLADQDAAIDDVYYSANHDSIGASLDQKPGSLLFEKAIYKHNIDPKRSLMIGDKERDVIPAEKLGIRGVQVEANSNILSIIESLEKV